jgi:hypothetical protein
MRPYVLDLSPFVGELTDGQPHQIDVATIGQGGCDGYWFLGGNLLVTTNKLSADRTTGGVTSYTGDPAPTSTSLGQQSLTVSDRTTSTHHLDISGVLHPAGGPGTTVVHVVEDMSNSAVDAALDVDSSWTWDSTTTRRTGPATSTDSQHSTYSLVRTGPTWTLDDDQDTSDSSRGATRTTSLRDSMSTAGPVLGVTGLVGASKESWVYSTSDGTCVDHELAAAAQNTVEDTVSNSCS